MLELETLRQEAWSQRGACSHVTEVTVGQFDSSGPVKTTVHERACGRRKRLLAQIQPAQGRRGTSKGAADVPVFVAQIHTELISPLRISGEWPGEIRPETQLLGVPSDQRFEVNSSATDIEELRIDSLEREAAKERQQPLPFGAEAPVSLIRAKDQVELSILARFEVESVIGENVQSVHSRLRDLQIVKAEHIGRSEGNGVIEQYRIYLEFRVELRLFDQRLGNAIPARERRLQVALQEIDARQKIIGVSVVRIEPKRASQIAGGLGIVLLLEADPGQLQKKTFVMWLLSKPAQKSDPGFIPSFQTGQRYSVVIVKLGGSFGFNLRKPDDILPAFFREGLFDLG